VNAVVSAEVDVASPALEVEGVDPVTGAGIEILDDRGAARRAVAPPQLPSVCIVEGEEEQLDPTTTGSFGSSNASPIDLTSTVPASVPSVLQSESFQNPMPVSATKNSSEPTAARRDEKPVSAGPGVMSLTMTVPASVPSLFHNSKPWSPSFALK
jgi:hypothetical protein